MRWYVVGHTLRLAIVHAILASQGLDQALESLIPPYIIAVPNAALDLQPCNRVLETAVTKLVYGCQQPDHISDSRLMPAVVQPDADLYLQPLPAVLCHILCMKTWTAQCRTCHDNSSDIQTYWILGATGCAYAHLKQDCSESRVEGLKIVSKLYHDRLELGLCTVCCQNA